jgi:hypothetical protein
MADAVASQTIQDGERLAILKFTNISDSTGETGVVKVDVSALRSSASGKACTGAKINKIWASTAGMGVDILWDATTDVLAYHIPTDRIEDVDFSCFGGLPNNSDTGKTGDILFTTVGHSAADRYTIVLEVLKTYD